MGRSNMKNNIEDKSVQVEEGPPAVSPEEEELLLMSIDKCAREKGLDAVVEEFDLVDLYKSGHLHGENMELFLLTIINQLDEGKKGSISRSMMNITRAESSGGYNEGTIDHINTLAKDVIDNLVVSKLKDKIPTPPESLRFLINELRKAKGHHAVKEGDGTGIRYVVKDFRNWGRTVRTNAIPTFIPRTKVGVCNIVKWAKRKNKKVRASGYRHSWSDITVNDDQVLVSLLPLRQAEVIPAKEVPIDPNDELEGIELLEETVMEDGIEKRLCKIGAGTTNEQFRSWVIKNSRDEKNSTWKPWWTVPFNVIMVEITFGGSNAPICHGAGRKTTTLSDLVYEIEFVNAKGELQTVKDPDLLKSAAGCFGMLGIVTAITMKLDPLTFARMIPQKTKVPLAIPPPKGFDVPENIDMSDITEEMLDNAFEEFKDHIENDYYAEWFWFPSRPRCWVQCWKNDGHPDEAVEYPAPAVVKNQEVFSFLNEILNSTVWDAVPPSVQMKVLSIFAMIELPEADSSNPIVTPLIEAIHFRRGIQNMRVRDMEWELPIPGLKSDPTKPDYSVCQKAWWVTIKAFYDRFNKDKNDIPMRGLPVEMRITGGSDMHLAPQHGNHIHGTCSIEILTPQNVDEDEWLDYCQEITDLWINLEHDDGTKIFPFTLGGKELYPRPHWAKEWEKLTVNGEPISKYVKMAYKDEVKLFMSGLKTVCQNGGYSLDDAKNMFETKFTQSTFSEDGMVTTKGCWCGK